MGWTTADAVQVGQKLVGAGGAVLTVVANRDWKPDGGVVVYNFQVEGDHTYFVGDIHAQGEWVWTHNACVHENWLTGQAGEITAGTFGPKKGVDSAITPGRVRYPDKLDKAARLLIETKNVAYQHLSTQLRDYFQIARRDGYQVVLNIRRNLPDGSPGTKLSASLQLYLQRNNVIVNRVL